MTSSETWNMLGVPTGAHDGHLTGANPTISGQLWVITPPNGYGLWGITGLCVIPCKPTRDQPKSMAYHGLWVLACMGYKGVDCIQSKRASSPGSPLAQQEDCTLLLKRKLDAASVQTYPRICVPPPSWTGTTTLSMSVNVRDREPLQYVSR